MRIFRVIEDFVQGRLMKLFPDTGNSFSQEFVKIEMDGFVVFAFMAERSAWTFAKDKDFMDKEAFLNSQLQNLLVLLVQDMWYFWKLFVDFQENWVESIVGVWRIRGKQAKPSAEEFSHLQKLSVLNILQRCTFSCWLLFWMMCLFFFFRWLWCLRIDGDLRCLFDCIGPHSSMWLPNQPHISQVLWKVSGFAIKPCP